MGGIYTLRIKVRTEDTRLTSRAFMLASSRAPPKPVGSALVVQPTGGLLTQVPLWKVEGGRRRTACEEAVFGEDSYGVYEEDGDCRRG